MRVVAIIVVLGIKDLSIPELIIRAISIVQTMEAHPGTFPKPPIPFTTVRSNISDLMDKQAAFQGHFVPITVRNKALGTLVRALALLCGYVTRLANGDPTHAVLIASRAAMTLWSRRNHNKAHLAVKRVQSGVVKLRAKAVRGAKTNEWQYSLDGGKTWIDVEPTTGANVTISGLPLGKVVVYRHRVVTKNGRTNWSQPISAMVT
jgi:hypothetical protein